MRLFNVGLASYGIWGDKNETVVYAQVAQVNPGRMLIFRFYRNPRHSPKSLANRIVNCYHGLSVHDRTLSFRDEGAMRSATWSSLTTAWPCCATDPNVFEPGTVIDLSSDDSEGLIWCIYRSPLFNQYLGLLRHIQRSDLVPPIYFASTIDIGRIHLFQPTGGRGGTKRGQVYRVMGKSNYFFFKSIDFTTYLQLYDDDNEFIRAAVETWRQSSKLVADMPPHPNV